MGHSGEDAVHKIPHKMKTHWQIQLKFSVLVQCKILYRIRYNKINVILVQCPFKHACFFFFFFTFHTDISSFRQTDKFFKFDSSTYKWIELPKLKTARDGFSLIHHEGYLYAIGGTRQKKLVDTIERFNLATQTWDGVYQLSEGVAFTSAVIFDGKIFIYGTSDEYEEFVGVYVLIVFDLATKRSKTVLVEGQETWMDYTSSCVLVVHDGILYRVCYKDENPDGIFNQMLVIPQVNRIEVKKLRNGGLRAWVGDEVGQQNVLSPNEANTFHIDKQIYINVARYTHKTGRVLGQQGPVGWSKCTNLTKQCVVEYTLDYSKLYGQQLLDMQNRL